MSSGTRCWPGRGRARATWALFIATLSACVPIEARSGLGAIESEAADGAICSDGAAEDGSGEGNDASARDASHDAPGSPPPTSGFRLEATPLRAEVDRGSRITFEVRVVRASGFTAPIVVQAFGLPTGCAAEPVAAADRPAALVVTAEGLAPASSHAAFAIHGSAAGHRATLRAEIAVTGPPIFEE